MTPPETPLDILYRDDHLVAVNKPAGLLTHRSDIDRHETRFAMKITRDQLGRHVFPVHRLDRPTSGLLLFALDSATARAMSLLFSSGQISKRYLAVARGYTPPEGHIDYPLVEQPDPISDARARPEKPAQPAITRFTRLATTELPHPVGRYPTARYSLISVHPETGRKHQIRRHLKHIFHPLIGDTSHGDGRHNRFFRDHLDCHRLLLAATQLHFTHPVTGQALKLSAPLDPLFRRTLDQLGWAELQHVSLHGSSH